MRKRIFSAFLAVILIFGMMPVTAFAADSHNHDGKTFQVWNSTNSLPTTSGSYYLTNDVTFNNSRWEIPSNQTINLCLNGHVIKLNGAGGGNNNISINLGATLNLYDCGTAEHKFTVDANGLWTLNESATENYETVTGGCITGGVNGTGGAIYLSWSNDAGAIGATLNMYGGNIVGNKATGNGGGAVYVDRPSTFNMYGGKIVGNIATKNGGAVYLHTEDKGRNVTFNMSGGEIRDNKAAEFGGGVYVESNIGTFNMSGGTIAGCSAQKGGGVFTYGSMTMSGDGAIRDCMATIDGGGVCACNCSFSMTGNSVVRNCVADNGGGGVYSWAGTGATANFTMRDASKIENCVAKYTYASNLRSGGGLCVENSTFTMTGGAITNNTSATDGGGVYYMSGNATLGSTAKITDNVKGDTLSGGTANNIYLPDNNLITFGAGDNSPQTGMSVGVTTQTAPEEGTPVQITTNGESTDTSFFTPDSDAYEVKFNANHLELAVKATSHNHVFTYAANNGKLTATCTAGCDGEYNTNPLTLTLTVPSSLVYDGTAKAVTFADGEADAWTVAGLELPTITYAAKSESSLTNGKAVNAGSYTASITVATDKTATADFEITKATPYIQTNPSPSDINYGEKLSDSTLVGGYVQVSSTNSNEVAGQFTWDAQDTTPTIADSDTTLYDVTFTPVDTDNFNTVSCEVTITVNSSHTHNLVKVDGQAATVTVSGWKDYYECACGEYFEDASGNTSITNLDEWKAVGGNGYIARLSAPKYGIAVLNDGNGTASASVSEAESGTTVTLTAIPSPGYVFDSWEVMSGGITISNNSFTMPADAVEVKAKFKLATPEPGPTPDPEPDPEPQGNYLDPLDDMFEEAIATGNTDTIYWDEGDALPNYIMKLLFENPNLSFDFKYTYEGVEHEIYIGPGQATNDDIEWYGPLWLLAKYGEKKDISAIPIHGVYVIQKGDTLNDLAKKFNTTVDALLSLNPAIKNKNLIYPGTTLNY